MRNISHAFHLFLSLFVLTLGLLFFSLPFSQQLTSLFFSHLPLFSLLGLGLMVFGIFFVLGHFSLVSGSALTFKISSYEVSLSLIQEAILHFCEKKHPEKKIAIEVFRRKKQRLEIVVHLKNGQLLDKEDRFLQEFKKEIKEFLSRQFDYQRTFYLTILPSAL